MVESEVKQNDNDNVELTNITNITDTTNSTNIALEVETEHKERQQDVDDDVSEHSDDESTRTQKSYPTRKRRTSSRLSKGKGSPVKSLKASKKINQKSPQDIEIKALRENNVVLTKAIKILEATTLSQGKQINDLTDRIDNTFKKEMENMMTRISLIHSDQEKKCATTKVEVIDAFNKRFDKISTKVDTAMKAVKNKKASFSHHNNADDEDTVQKSIEVLKVDMEKLDHEIAKMQDSISNLIDDNTPFTPVTPAKNAKANDKSELFTSPRVSLSDTNERSTFSPTNISAPSNRDNTDNTSTHHVSEGRPPLKKSIIFIDSNRNFLDPKIV